MMQFKTIALPATTIKVKKSEMYTIETANLVIAPVAKAIQDEARGGWNFVSYVSVPGTVKRKKGILEILLGWIPIVGILFQSRAPDYITTEYYCVIFQKEV